MKTKTNDDFVMGGAASAEQIADLFVDRRYTRGARSSAGFRHARRKLVRAIEIWLAQMPLPEWAAASPRTHSQIWWALESNRDAIESILSAMDNLRHTMENAGSKGVEA